ncbi:hypothetical protein BD626DRAFT_475724 [Schizophyllum amplum]|uniref:Uncharacterized protein n=1 Tax=Schizophyllum amplum TaxID=97359 RepID=A0A550CYN2_9AGAR|nr:hypothetical protein BD626DRAFT_475724 [Auriculariopsis ampla]
MDRQPTNTLLVRALHAHSVHRSDHQLVGALLYRYHASRLDIGGPLSHLASHVHPESEANL